MIQLNYSNSLQVILTGLKAAYVRIKKTGR